MFDSQIAVTAIRWVAHELEQVLAENSRLRLTVIEARSELAVGDAAAAADILGRCDA